MREPAVSGLFYSGSERTLKNELKSCFNRGPGRTKPSSGKRVKGLVSPHAGFTYSGPTAAFGFLAAADGGWPSTVIVLGPNHSGLGKKIGVSKEDFRTPLGVMKNDNQLSDALNLGSDELSHLREHSMEVQLPFIQFFTRNVEQVCISLGHPGGGFSREDEMKAVLKQAEDLSERIIEAIEVTGRDIMIVASSDFTHCGPNYGYPVPGDMNAGEFARTRDLPVIESLLKGEVKKALIKKEELGTTACGMGPILTMMRTLQKMGEVSFELLNYTTSYDVSPSHSAVGYASIAAY